MEQITSREIEYLRKLAQKQREYAELPIMQERAKRWTEHNGLRGDMPMVMMEEETFVKSVLPTSECESDFAKFLELKLRQNIFVHEHVGDDKVIPNFIDIPLAIDVKWYDVELEKTYAKDGVAFHIEPTIEIIEDDFEKLSDSKLTYDEAKTKSQVETAQEIFKDILDVKLYNDVNRWNFTATQKIVDLMGMENMFCSMMTEPDEFIKLIEFVTDDAIRILRWEEQNGLILPNVNNDYMGSGNICFSDELPNKLVAGVPLKSTDVWGHFNSQESVGVSGSMYHELIFPSLNRLSQEFGLLYYGCCEPVETIWDDSVSKYKNLRKVSISPWCNEEIMSEKLSDGKVIYSRKPSPNFIGIEKNFDEAEFRKYIRKTMQLTKNCKREFIFRDIYQLNGNLEKVKRAVEIVREEATL